MKRILISILIIVASFMAGYGLGRCRPVKAKTGPGFQPAAVGTVPAGSQAPGSRAEVEHPSVVQPAAVGTVTADRRDGVSRDVFNSLMDDYLKQVNALQDKINSMLKVSSYMRQQTQDAVKAQSLEGSMVYEANYRESLHALLGLKDELISVLAKALQASRDYATFLENR